MLPLTRGEISRASPKDQEAVLDFGEAFPLGVVVLGGFFCVFFGCNASVVPTQDGALLEGVLGGSPMIRAWLLQHFVEETEASRSPLGVLAIRRGDQVFVRPTLLPLTTLFLLLRVLETRGLGGLGLLFPLGAAIGENWTNCLFTRGEVGGDIEQLASAHGGLTPELVYQLLTGGAGDEGSDDVEVRDVGELGALLGETPDEISERLIRLLSTAPEVPGVPRAYVCALEVLDKDPNQVCPTVDQTLREVLEPRPG